jgi:broad specificity phosphatase PhoE
MARDPAGARRWLDDPGVAPPGGESLVAFAARVRAQRAATVAEHPGEVVAVVTHGGAIAAAVHEALDAGFVALWRVRIDPGSITVVRYWADGGVQVVTMNSTAHLAHEPRE